MKVQQPKEKFTSLKTLILQLQLSLELSQLQELLSAYSDFLLFFAEYSFLFETSHTETSLSQSTYTPSDTSFSTQDPARDGVNWWNYCNSNPLVYTDPNGKVPAHLKDYPGWSHYAPQRIFGYFNVYDAMSTLLIFNINGTKIEGETFTLRMWKGTYGLAGVGGEVGLYSKHGRALNKNDLDSLGMTSSTFDLFDNESGEKIVYRTEKVSSFWTTAFRPSKHRNKSNITAEFNLNFENEQKTKDFYNQIKGTDKKEKAEEYYWNYSFFKKNPQSVNVIIGEDKKSVRITYGNKPPDNNKNKGKKEEKNE